MNLSARWGEGSEAGKSSSVMDERKSEVDATIRGELCRLPSYVFFHCMLTRVATTNSTNKNPIANKLGGRYNRGWAETSNGEKVWISQLFDTMNKLWKEEKAKVGDIFDNRNSGIIWKSRLLWWCIIDDPQPYWCLGKIWKFGSGSHFKRRIVCKSWLMRRWARCWKRGRVSTRRLTLGINQLEFKSE